MRSFINYIYIKNIIKILFFILLLFSPLTLNSYAEINSKKWTLNCTNAETKEGCIVAITKELKNKQVLATAYIGFGITTENKMVLVSEDDQTYKLDRSKKNIPVLFVNLPLDVDLRKLPLVVIDDAKKKIGDLIFMRCNREVGCKSMMIFNEKNIELFQKGKVLKIYCSVYGNEKPILIDFSLKGFTKAYESL